MGKKSGESLEGTFPGDMPIISRLEEDLKEMMRLGASAEEIEALKEGIKELIESSRELERKRQAYIAEVEERRREEKRREEK